MAMGRLLVSRRGGKVGMKNPAAGWGGNGPEEGCDRGCIEGIVCFGTHG